jgi:hypothetical protein
MDITYKTRTAYKNVIRRADLIADGSIILKQISKKNAQDIKWLRIQSYGWLCVKPIIYYQQCNMSIISMLSAAVCMITNNNEW